MTELREGRVSDQLERTSRLGRFVALWGGTERGWALGDGGPGKHRSVVRSAVAVPRVEREGAFYLSTSAERLSNTSRLSNDGEPPDPSGGGVRGPSRVLATRRNLLTTADCAGDSANSIGGTTTIPPDRSRESAFYHPAPETALLLRGVPSHGTTTAHLRTTVEGDWVTTPVAVRSVLDRPIGRTNRGLYRVGSASSVPGQGFA